MPIKFYIYGAIAIFLLTAVAGTVFYINYLQSENETLTKNNAILTVAVDTQKATIKTMVDDAVKIGETIIIVNKQFRDARSANNVLRTKLAEHDVGFLAEKKPALIKKIVNKGTADVGRCFEILSGSPLTTKEKTATKKSQTNGSCSDIANPAYRVKP